MTAARIAEIEAALARVEDPARLRALVGALMTVGSDLSLPDVLRRIVQAAMTLVDARYGALGVVDEAGKGLSEFVFLGISEEEAARIGHVPEGHGVLGLLILDARPLRLPTLSDHPDSYGFPPGHPPMDSFLGVPIRVRDQVFGNLYLTQKESAPSFDETDEALVVALARAAGIAIEEARLHARVRELTVFEERERIAADLHDLVIQRLFATGLALQGCLRLVERPDVSDRLGQAVDDLDGTIRQIRTTIFALSARGRGGGLRAELIDLASQAAPSLGFEPAVHLEGPIDTLVGDELGGQLLAVLREALANVAKHAHASTASVDVRVDPSAVEVVVTDDGIGAGAGTRVGGHGLGNLRHRAEALGGTMELATGPGGTGTVLRWAVPLRRAVDG